MTIKGWPHNDRPREKLLTYGAEYLTNAELLAIFLRTGVKGKTAVDLGRELLTEFGSLQRLFAANLVKFCQKRGLGSAKYAQLQAILELSRRYLYEQMQQNTILANSTETKQYLLAKIGHLKKEIFIGILLDSKNQIITSQEIFRGSLSYVHIYPRELITLVLNYQATSIIFAHNHPSGNPNPSQEDLELTKMLQNTLSLIEVNLLDHLIVGKQKVISLKEQGLL